jgi:hypothetical protein
MSINVVMFKSVVATMSSSPYVVSSSTSSKLFYSWGDSLYGSIVYISLRWVFASIALGLKGQISISLNHNMMFLLINV